jgi:ABC-type multidrug transport system fused ATPase/permease subunit
MHTYIFIYLSVDDSLGMEIISQDPVLFSTTVRANLDPNEVRSDKDIWEVLGSVNAKEAVARAGGLGK